MGGWVFTLPLAAQLAQNRYL